MNSLDEVGYQVLPDFIGRQLLAALRERIEELFAEAYERMRPFISQEYVDEMHGLAHGSRLPLEMVHAVHALPELTEWGGKKKIKQTVKGMMEGIIGTSCSNICANGSATKDGRMYTVRILDWGLHRISKLHEYPLLTINVPDHGIPSCNIGWVGFLGAVSGMNAQGITLGEMGYGDPENETLSGEPMPFMLRNVLSYAGDLKEAQKIVKNAPGTSSFIFLMSDGKTGKSEIYIKDHDRFKVSLPGEALTDKDNTAPAIGDVLYGGHYLEKMTAALNENKGQITPELLMKTIIPQIAPPGS